MYTYQMTKTCLKFFFLNHLKKYMLTQPEPNLSLLFCQYYQQLTKATSLLKTSHYKIVIHNHPIKPNLLELIQPIPNLQPIRPYKPHARNPYQTSLRSVKEDRGI